jgi:hypothetical protein
LVWYEFLPYIIEKVKLMIESSSNKEFFMTLLFWFFLEKIVEKSYNIFVVWCIDRKKTLNSVTHARIEYSLIEIKYILKKGERAWMYM